MTLHLQSPLGSILSKLLLFALSFVDDAAMLFLSQQGFDLQWLQWLSPVLLSLTAIGWGIRLSRHFQLAHTIY
ncbi:hypothetical protein K9N68_17920 [Kovacikia minuta CCNUW1]|uniref:hypothetical protein n=1 Tax=Kovacikia minuta TaxID=2931930 RepID=UPI001CCDCAAD|nr:hypothetical protein [Kovacikia minuta]UBF23650.1 hypothetical protein K9N68_17920 [Kovacikia minuta CCNUW1]